MHSQLDDLELSLTTLRNVVADQSLPLAARMGPAKLLAELKLKESAQQKNSSETRASGYESQLAAENQALMHDAATGNELAVQIRNAAEHYQALVARWRRLQQEPGQ